jgi:hypothetical protein
MNLYHIKLTDDQKDALERLFDMGIVWSKTELSEAWEQLREQVREASCTVAIINALQDSECNCKKPTEPTPKYDPNRKFRKGDIVKPCQVKGRWQSITWKGCSGMHFTVTEDEDEDGIVSIKAPDCKLPSITSAVFFELVTPVEELEPYSVVDAHTHWDVADKNMKTVATYSKGHHPNAKVAAEAERDRLNAKWRKEMEK